MVGCWGVYCRGGEIEIESYNPKQNKVETKRKIFGQKGVSKGMKEYARDREIAAVFLAGDNVYPHEKLKDAMKKIIDTKEWTTLKPKERKRLYKSTPELSPNQIEEQFKKGFEKCFEGLNIDDFWGALGNHDIQTCKDLNYQLNYKNSAEDTKFHMPAMHYNVIYSSNRTGSDSQPVWSVNFIVIDTNVYEEDPKQCGGEYYDDNYITAQEEWVLEALKSGDCAWNVIVGHIPYKANPHKKQKSGGGIHNKKLGALFGKIRDDGSVPNVQVYMCADEHNQQFLYDPAMGMALVVAGSGGTALDKDILLRYTDGKSSEVDTVTRYRHSGFGFTHLKFEEDILTITYVVTATDKHRIKASFKLDLEANIVE
jgi:hypothetical protein